MDKSHSIQNSINSENVFVDCFNKDKESLNKMIGHCYNHYDYIKIYYHCSKSYQSYKVCKKYYKCIKKMKKALLQITLKHIITNNITKIKKELTNNIKKMKKTLLQITLKHIITNNIKKIKKELTNNIKKELTNNIKKMKKELTNNIKKIKKELTNNIKKIKKELTNNIKKIKKELNNIKKMKKELLQINIISINDFSTLLSKMCILYIDIHNTRANNVIIDQFDLCTPSTNTQVNNIISHELINYIINITGYNQCQTIKTISYDSIFINLMNAIFKEQTLQISQQAKYDILFRGWDEICTHLYKYKLTK